MDELNRILEKYEFKKNPAYNSGLINQIEQSIGFMLPPDYLFYLKNFSKFEDFIGNAYVVLWDLENLLENNNGYCIAEWLPSFLGIGSNGGGELLAIEYSDNQTYKVALVPFCRYGERCRY